MVIWTFRGPHLHTSPDGAHLVLLTGGGKKTTRVVVLEAASGQIVIDRQMECNVPGGDNDYSRPDVNLVLTDSAVVIGSIIYSLTDGARRWDRCSPGQPGHP